MMRSMFAGVSGLQAHQLMLDTVGDNIANVNTAGFKSSRVQFEDTLSQVLRGDSAPSAANGAIAPEQVGLGVHVGGVQQVMTQGALQNTGRATDLAIQGPGYFGVRQGAETLYTRAGAFTFDQQGSLTDPTGAIVQGWIADAAGTVTKNGPTTDLTLPLGQALPPTPTKNVTLSGNLSADDPVNSPTTPDVVKTSINAVDSQGATHKIAVSMTKSASNTWTVGVDSVDGSVAPATVGTITFGTDGKLQSTTPSPMQFTLAPAGSAATTVSMVLPVSGSDAFTQFGGTSTAVALQQDGSQAGFLSSFSIGNDGKISGVFSNGQQRVLGQVALASFKDPSSLSKAGNGHLRSNGASGNALVTSPGGNGTGTLAAGSLEMSNVDLSQEFTNLIIAQRGFEANSKIISTSDELLNSLIQLKR
jgi:flagellar hook protein FlgE